MPVDIAEPTASDRLQPVRCRCVAQQTLTAKPFQLLFVQILDHVLRGVAIDRIHRNDASVHVEENDDVVHLMDHHQLVQ